jgi:hypothetical protein
MVLSAQQIIGLIRGEKIPYGQGMGSVVEMDFNDSCDPDALSDIAEAAYERVSQIDNDDEE